MQCCQGTTGVTSWIVAPAGYSFTAATYEATDFMHGHGAYNLWRDMFCDTEKIQRQLIAYLCRNNEDCHESLKKLYENVSNIRRNMRLKQIMGSKYKL
jgi:hypothetical protein